MQDKIEGLRNVIFATDIGGLARPFAQSNLAEGAPPLSRFVRQGGGFDFLSQESNARLPSAPACVRSIAIRSPPHPHTQSWAARL